MGFIYLVENNINGKKYVGQTVNSINTRWIQHKSEAKRLVPNVYFIRAINKYGPENFTVSQLEECDDCLLDEREQYYIKLYDTFNKDKGYNSTYGGNSNNKKYDRTQILQLWNNGYSVGEIANLIKSCPQTVSSVLHDFEISKQETRKRGQKLVDRKKKIFQYDLNGNLINTFSWIGEAVEKTGIGETTIRDVCNHRRATGYGYIWCHEDEQKNIQQLIKEIPIEKTKHPIAQYTLQGKLIKLFNSIIDASKELHVSCSALEDALTNKSYNCLGYLWKYQDDPTDILEKVKRNNHKKDYMKKKIKQFTLQGEFINNFDSAADAAKAIGKNNGGSSIIKACRGKLKSAYGYKWSYAES